MSDLAAVVYLIAGDLLERLSGYDDIGREPADGPPAQVRLRARNAGPEEVDVDLLAPWSTGH